jgi:FixJ family two-component response regulator
MPTLPGSVIIVDDDEAVRNSLKFALEQEGLVVRTYKGGAELLAATDLPENACLVIDYYMPLIDGVELFRRLRSRHVELPAILITAKATDDVRRSAASAGIARVLEKPLEDSSLFDSIRRVLDAAA